MSSPVHERPRSPKILGLCWGRMDVEGLGPGRDYKLWPGGGRSWDWNETDTHHVPGIQPADVSELLDHGSRVVILSRGQLCRLGTCPETLQLLREAEVEFHIEETRAAIALYNRLVSERPVGGLFHSTC